MTEYLQINPVDELIKALRIVHGDAADAILLTALVQAQVKLVSLTSTGSQAVPNETRPQRQAMQHELKSWPCWFRVILSGQKTFEIRRADRDFRVGDTIFLREYDPTTCTYSGREVFLHITHVMHLKDWLDSQNIDWSLGSHDKSASVVVMSFKVEKWRRPDDSQN